MDWNLNLNLYRQDWRLPLNPFTDEPFSKFILLPFMKDMGTIPSQDDVAIRMDILKILEERTKDWIAEVSHRYNKDLNAEIVPYGSFGLEVYSKTSDMDILVVAPELASLQDVAKRTLALLALQIYTLHIWRERNARLHNRGLFGPHKLLEGIKVHLRYDFFGQFRKLVETIPGAIDVRSIETAKVPLLKFKMHGVEVEVACARLSTMSIPRAENLCNQFCLQSAVDSQSRMSLESVMSNLTILRVVGPNIEIFIEATRLLKYWASSRGIYENMICYIGGIHLSVMIAYACSSYKGRSLAGFIAYFFAIFSRWMWRSPVKLQMTRTAAPSSLVLRVQKPGTDSYCTSNVTNLTLQKITNELERGFNLTRDLSWEWALLLERFPYDSLYRRFIKVRISVVESDLKKWMGFVKSRLAVLIRLLEEDNVRCDPELTEFMDLPSAKITGYQAKNRVFLWGIVADSGQMYNLTRAESDWKKNLMSNGDGSSGEIKLAVVPLKVFRTYKRHNLVID